MATCPKCGKPKIKKRAGVKSCTRCGPFHTPPDDGVTRFEVWSSGFLISGMEGIPATASHHGLWPGETFEEACEAYSNSTPQPSYYNREKNTYWGCAFHDNETDARKSFG